MTKVGCFLSFTILLMPGCSSTIELTSALDANRKVGNSAAIVQLRSGLEYQARELHVGLDSTRCVEKNSDSVLQFPTRDIRSIQVAHHIGGAAEGLVIGGASGSALGLASSIGLNKSDKGGAIFVCLVLGGVGGLVIGALKGHDVTFVFPDDTTAVWPTPPSGSIGATKPTINDSAP